MVDQKAQEKKPKKTNIKKTMAKIYKNYKIATEKKLKEEYKTTLNELRNLAQSICPTTNYEDPFWEKIASDIIYATLLAMLEDNLPKKHFSIKRLKEILVLEDTTDKNAQDKVDSYLASKSDDVTIVVNYLAEGPVDTKSSFFDVIKNKLSVLK